MRQQERGVSLPDPIEWRVVWGRSVTTGFKSIVVRAFDADEALLRGHEAHPELLRPNFALPLDPHMKTYDESVRTSS